jgi:uncharacterized protein (TIGR03437 family)
MKCVITVAFILSAAATAFGQQNPITFATGQSARLVIGQPEFDAEMDSASQTILGSMSGLAYANNTLFVADANLVGSPPVNNRVVIFGNLSQQLPAPNAALQYTTLCPVCVGSASNVLGQSTYTGSLPSPCIIPPSTVTVTTTPTTPTCLTTSPQTPIATGMNTPTAVASDGIHLAVADTLNNRVLIWNTLPTAMNQSPDVVIGQPGFTTNSFPPTPAATSLRGPQGVWIQNGQLFIADTMDDRILIFNSIPTANGAAADLVLGQPNLTTWVQVDISQQNTNAAANNMLTPVSVTSDGTRLFVADLGYNRVLIWNTIPTTTQQPADVEIGQPGFTTGIPDNAFSVPTSTTVSPPPETAVLCTASNGVDTNNSPTYPPLCAYTLSFPRFALSDGKNLYVADGGNDRVLIFSPIPTTNAAAATTVLGQTDFLTDAPTDGADTMDAPLSLAWDPVNLNLYVADTYNQRILVYTESEQDLPYNGVLNSASVLIYALDPITIGGTIKAGDTVEFTIGYSTTTTTASYTYTVQSGDTFTSIVDGLVALINAGSGDPNVIASADPEADIVVLTARVPGVNGNNVSVATTVTGTVTATSSAPSLTGGASTASVAPGTLVSFFGTNLSDQTASADLSGQLPLSLGGVQVYFNGVQAPLLYVSPTQINAQIHFNFGFARTGTANAWVRITRNDGTVVATDTVAVTIVPANPGIFAFPGSDPREAYAYHSSSNATGVISVDGTIKVGDIGTICIGSGAALTAQSNAPATGCTGQSYNYTVQAGDSLAAIRDAYVALLAADPQVSATPSSEFTRIMLQARAAGTAGNGIPYNVAQSTDADLLLTAIGQAPPSPQEGALMCCASTAGAPVTVTNAALPGETVVVYATGLGLPVLAPDVDPFLLTGQPWKGPPTVPQNFVASQIDNATANVLRAELVPGMIGTYQVYLNLPSSMSTDPKAELYIAQNDFRSNVVKIPVFATPVLSAVQCNPDTVTAGDTTTCTVLLTVAQPTGQITVTLTSSDNVNFPVPTSITIAGGTTSSSFTVTAGSVSSTEDVTVTATLNSLTSTTTVTLNPS